MKKMKDTNLEFLMNFIRYIMLGGALVYCYYLTTKIIVSIFIFN